MNKEKRQFLEKLDAFVDAWTSLSVAWDRLDDIDFEKTFDDGTYPFDLSFGDEWEKVVDWRDDLREKLTKD